MPVSRYFTYVGSALLVLLFVSNACLDDDESNCGSTDHCTRAPCTRLAWKKPRTTAELRFTRDVTPAVRVREVFAVFVPNERRRGKRYS